MPIFLRIIIIFIVVFYSGIHKSSFAYSEQVNIDQQLLEIENIVDKNEVLNKLITLENVSTLTPKQHSLVLHALGRAYYSVEDLDHAIATFEQAQILAKNNGFKLDEAEAYKNIGIFHYFKGENTQALAAYQASINYYSDADNPIKRANLLNNIGLVYASMGNTRQTLRHYQLAESIYQKHGTKQDKVDIRYNIAGLYIRLKRYDIAIEMFLKVKETRIELKDEVGLANVYGDLGIAYKQSGDYKAALSYTLDALHFYQNNDDKYNTSAQMHNLSELYNQLKEPEKAIVYAKQAIVISEQQGHKNAFVGSLHSLAQALFYQGHAEQALKYLYQSHKIAQEINNEQQLNDNLALFSLIYASLGDSAKALEKQREYINQNNKRSNEALNEELALFESEQLKQQVAQLQQSKKLEQLKNEKHVQLQNFIIIAIFFILLVGFFLYRRTIDRRSKEILEMRVKLRTQKLELLTEELQTANAVKSQFLANMSHEIRTPLTSIMGQAEAIVSGDVDDKLLNQEVAIIHENSLYLLELINNILDLSKIEANKLELELKSQNLHVILHELANMFTKQAKVKGLVFEVVHELPYPFIIDIDGFRLKQVLINLCSNAIKFTAEGMVSLYITTVEEGIIFTITDSGIGMSETQLQQVFNSFTQGDSSISRRFGGSGLGLCLSDQLAKLMGAQITVESTLNRGSVFSMILPCANCKTSTFSKVTLQVMVDEPVLTVVDDFSGKILLADDHDGNRRLIARLLRSLGLDVFTANSGKEVIEMFFEHHPQLILLDIQMPEMDGIEAFKILRQKGCKAPIIALTANAMSHEVQEYLSIGFDGHLKKPIERQNFIATLNQYFGKNSSELNVDNTFDKIDMSDLIIQFKSNLVLEQQDILLHIKNDDLDKLAQLTHRIAGAAQMFGFALLSEKALKVELTIKSNKIDLLSDITQLLLNEIDQVLW